MSKNVLSVALISQANNSTFAWFSKLNVWAWQSSTQLSLVCFVRVTTKRHKAQRPPVKSLLQKMLLQKGLPKMFLIDLHLILLFEIICIQNIFVLSYYPKTVHKPARVSRFEILGPTAPIKIRSRLMTWPYTCYW